MTWRNIFLVILIANRLHFKNWRRSIKNKPVSWVWWFAPVIPALARYKQEDPELHTTVRTS